MSAPHGQGIRVAFPDTQDRHLKISVAACRLLVTPSDGDTWITGDYRDPNDALPLRVIQEGGRVRIEQTHSLDGIINLMRGAPTLELHLSAAHPYRLTLETGASDAELDLGGLPLSQLAIKQGAGKCALAFSSPSPEEMHLLELSSGAAFLTMKTLANTNAAVLSLEGGAATYDFDFGGVLQRDMRVRISTGVSAVAISIPGSSAAKLTVESFLGSVDVDEGFTRKDGAIWTRAGLEGRVPLMIIEASIALGGLTVRTT